MPTAESLITLVGGTLNGGKVLMDSLACGGIVAIDGMPYVPCVYLEQNWTWW